LEREQTPLPEIRQTVVIRAPIERVWEKVSTAEGIAAWFMPNDFEPKVGHEFHVQSPFGPSPCKVTEVEPLHRISFIWDTEGWVVTFLLKEAGEHTEFTLIHGGWKHPEYIMAKAGRPAGEIRGMMNQGWAGIVEDLRRLLENP